MFQREEIRSFDDPRLLPYRNMRRQLDHAEQEIFVAEGEKVVRRLLESPLPVTSVLLPPKWFSELEPILAARPETIQVFVAEKEVLQDLTGFSMYQGVLALSRIPPSLSLEDILGATRSPRFFMAIEGLSNPENIGSLVRSGVGFGVQGLIVGETCPTPYLRRSVRSSMGTIFKMPFVQPPKLAEAIRWLRERQVKCVAAHPHTDRRTIYDTNLTGDCCIVFGAEGAGLSKEVLDACDEAVAIPMQSEVDSLNVSSAAAVFLYEVARQRQALRT